jgi:hypothetical protein
MTEFLLDTFIDLSTLGMCHLKTVSLTFFTVRPKSLRDVSAKCICKNLQNVSAKIRALEYANMQYVFQCSSTFFSSPYIGLIQYPCC